MLSYERLIALEGAHNVRDLGGYCTGDGGFTRWRSILRGDALHALSDRDIEILVKAGLTTVIDLRNPVEIELEASPFPARGAVRYLNTSLFSDLAPVEMMAAGQVEFDMGDRYCQGLDSCGPAIAEVLSAIAEADDGIVLFHCSAGKDRTGVIAALLLANAGVDEQTIIEDYALTATISGPLIDKLRRRALARGTSADLVEAILASRPESMARAMAHLALRHGGVGQYLRQIGLGAAEIGSLARRLA